MIIAHEKNLNRYRLIDEIDGAALIFERQTHKGEPHIAVYQDHAHQAIRDQLEALDVSNWLSLQDMKQMYDLMGRMIEKMEGK